MQRTWIGLGALAGLTAVAMAALAAHGPGGAAPAAVQSGIEMQGWHALALLACGLWAPHGGRLANWAGTAFTLGIVLFCSGVYAFGFGITELAMMAPIGGTLLMVGWALLGVSALVAGRRSQSSGL